MTTGCRKVTPSLTVGSLIGCVNGEKGRSFFYGVDVFWSTVIAAPVISAWFAAFAGFIFMFLVSLS